MIKALLDEVIRADTLTSEFGIKAEYKKLMIIVKRLIYAYFGTNIVNCVIFYLPLRLNSSNGIYGVEPCFGFDLTAPWRRLLCAIFTSMGDFAMICVIIHFQTLLLFLIAFISSMFLLLAEEIVALNKCQNTDYALFVREKLPSLIYRHILILNMIKYLKFLYSNPLGVNFGINAVFMCFFFNLPLNEWIAYIPMLFYCILIFFMYCYLCQKLINASEVFEKAVYGCGWEKFHLNEMKTIYIMLKLAQRPIRLLAADMIPVTMYTFASTLQFIFKFVTVVKC